jgi:large subunit ribosomal protein L15|tara:strand:+ start:524 stop:976 length:453 start_codon:yes stop_codon:yes gene_type:complete
MWRSFEMRLNTLQPKIGSRFTKKRKGKGHASGQGKTSGRGHKGQKSRSGGFHKTGFEGGQMPLQRRLPKRGFASRKLQNTHEVRLSDLSKVEEAVIDLDALKNANIVPRSAETIKVIATGEINKALTIQGLHITVKAKDAIENAGGKVID